MVKRICSECKCHLRNDEKLPYWHGKIVCNICYRKLFNFRKNPSNGMPKWLNEYNEK